MHMETHDTDKTNTWQSLSAATERLLSQPEEHRADQNQRREENESEKHNDEAVRREIAWIESRMRLLNWWEFCLRGYAQRH